MTAPAFFSERRDHSFDHNILALPEPAVGDRRRNRGCGVVALRNDPDAEDDARTVAPIIFDGWSEADVPALGERLPYQRSAADLAPDNLGLAPEVSLDVERQHPFLGEAVLDRADQGRFRARP